MEQAFLLQGLEAIAGYFGERWKPESVKAVMTDLLKEPDAALINAHARVYAEMNPRPFPPIVRIAEIIKDEGRKHRMSQAKEREDAWRREKGEDASGRVNGDPLRDAARKSKLGSDALQLIDLVLSRKLNQKEKAEGAQHMAMLYPGIGYEELASAWRNGRDLGE